MLILEEECWLNGYSKDGDSRDDVNMWSELDFFLFFGWDDGFWSFVLDLCFFYGVVEEGVFVNVIGSFGDELEDFGCFVFENCDDDIDGEIGDLYLEEFVFVKFVYEELFEVE